MFRLINASDSFTLKQIYQKVVQELAPSLYNEEQVIAWSAFPNDQDKFNNFILKPDTYIIEKNQEIIGFCGLEKNGHIASLYIHPKYTRQGYGTQLLQYVLNQGIKQGITKFYTEASFFSQPVFQRCGFEIIEMETVKYGVVSFERYKMEKRIIEEKNE
ncbi:GNAT family N-acetyltransferase [Cyanobacterium stanieri LEGE 03274]|uniref:GNAT family N-acetyltransferase n=1 Tax=Cyanobacterium stanieri LEGE 03274 TaxID=1828756 RepID=A0ABR9V302_9CHRO|nr:GNAT family N-acetyltransferase [Cyanobacterium stanieri]MBE9222257.1 GNAT family N-acetyltransferase [Cyanobacterium stanieri LEGE 03274]